MECFRWQNVQATKNLGPNYTRSMWAMTSFKIQIFLVFYTRNEMVTNIMIQLCGGSKCFEKSFDWIIFMEVGVNAIEKYGESFRI